MRRNGSQPAVMYSRKGRELLESCPCAARRARALRPNAEKSLLIDTLEGSYHGPNVHKRWLFGLAEYSSISSLPVAHARHLHERHHGTQKVTKKPEPIESTTVA